MKKIKVYSTNTCPYCTMAKEFLEENNVKFENINVSDDQDAAEEMIEKSGQMGVPVVEIGDQIIVGFDEDTLGKALLKKKVA